MNCLIMPPQATGLDIECDNRREVQIVTSPVVAAILRDAVSRPEVHKPEIEVCRSDWWIHQIQKPGPVMWMVWRRRSTP